MKTVVITGVSYGLGLVVAEVFLKNGWNVVGTGRSSRPDNLKESIKYSQFDASDSNACANFWKQLQERQETTEVCLINNAGSYVCGGLVETQPTDYEKQMQSNYFSAVYMTRALAEVIQSARIINVISTSALAAHPSNGAYGAAKAAEMHFFQSIQQEFSAEKYRITNLYPSDIATHGADPEAIDPNDLANFILQSANSDTTYYLRDVSLYPSKRRES